MYRVIAFLVILAIGGIVSLFTVSSKEVLKYNDHMVATLTAMDGSFQEILPYLSTYGDGGKVDIDAFRASVESTGRNLQTRYEEVKGTKVPDADVCREFHSTLTAYADNNLAIFEVYRTQSLPYIEAHNPGTPADIAAVEAHVGDLVEKDGQLLQQVQQRQASMAAKYKIKLQ